MNATDVLSLVIEITVASSGAVLLALLLRRPLRSTFGAASGYGIWSLVPAVVIAMLLPVAAVPVAMHAVTIQVLARGATAVLPHGAIDHALLACLIWACGIVVMASHFMRQQCRFIRALGRLTCRADGLLVAETNAGLPAAIGLLRPRIVLPADFAVRYSTEQQCLMQMHERTHIERGDLYVNAIAALLRCVFWFNPLMFFAARPFRHDQELACDQRVIARHPHARRAYGEAMFNTQLAAQPLPLGCHWLAFDHGRSHPLKERIAMLKQPVSTFPHLLGGSLMVAALTLAAGFTAWAAKPAQAMPVLTTASADALASGSAAAPSPIPNPSRMPPPAYPKQALKRGQDGTVVLLIDIGADGKPTAVQVDHSEPAGVFDAAAVDAAKHWTFVPERKDGKAVASRAQVPIMFVARRQQPNRPDCKIIAGTAGSNQTYCGKRG